MTVYACDPDILEQALRELLQVPASHKIHRWRCPCEPECEAFVLYTKAPGPDRPAFTFQATQAYQATAPTFHVDNIEDFELLLADETTSIKDRLLYSAWFGMGLREAILSAEVEPRVLKVACTKCGKIECIDERDPLFDLLEGLLKERGESVQSKPEPFGMCFPCAVPPLC